MDYVQINCLSAPTLNWDVMLNMKKVEFELIPDPDVFQV